MRIDYQRLIGEVRLACANPLDSRPSDDLLLMLAADEEQLLANEMENAPPDWRMGYSMLEVQPGVGIQTLAVESGFGKPERIHTVDDSDAEHITRKIPTCDRSQLDAYYRGPKQAQSGGPKHSAQVMTFWRERDSGVWMVEIVPEPIVSATYRIWYAMGSAGEATRGRSGVMPEQYYRYWKTRVALRALPYCRWVNCDDQEVLRSNLAAGLSKAEAENKRQWDRFILTNTRTGSTSPEYYGEDYMGSWW